uniref:hypothetical protein n=1 Tax=Salmonella enterica TaxID=28901 RepID=UPI003297A476
LAKYYLADYPGAIHEYTRALELKPNAAVTLKNRGTVYLQMDSFRLAVNDFSLTLRGDPDDGEALYKKGIALASL